MKLYILGTGTSQGVPVVGCTCPVCLSEDENDKRLRSSAVFEIDGRYLLIDTSPDFRQQMLKARIPRIDAILYTHEHNDHVIGLDDVRPYNFMQKTEMMLYGLPRVLAEVRKRFAYVFAENKYPGAPSASTNEINGETTVIVDGIEVIPINVIHGRLPILGYRIEDIAYITDASAIDHEEFEKLTGLKVLVINALRMQKHPSHFNLTEALDVIARVSPERAYITHVSHLMGKYKDWTKNLPPNVFGANDGLVIEV